MSRQWLISGENVDYWNREVVLLRQALGGIDQAAMQLEANLDCGTP